ncbi:MAG: ABC transporter transmembrane domain-containing protein, partial [Dehalococcoidia bacterium]|nr:ABC transporter transmembrane domain-containing protein [Dehalococcoidia bacterium]
MALLSALTLVEGHAVDGARPGVAAGEARMFLTRPLWALTAGTRGAIIGLIVIGLAITALGLASLALLGYAIGAVFAGAGWDAIAPLLAAAAGVALVRGALLFAKDALGSHVATQVKTRLRVRIFEHLLTLGPGYLDRKRTGELVALAVDSVEALETYYARYLPQIAVTVMAPVGIFVYLWTLHPVFAASMAVSLALALATPSWFRKLTARFGGEYWARYSSFWAMIVDSLQGLPTLKAFARAKDRGREITDGANAIARQMAKVFAVNFGVAGLMDLVVTGGATAALVA